MARIDPFATYVGAAGLVIGSIGLAFSGDASDPGSITQVSPGMAQVALPALVPAPVAFYAETVELIAPPSIRRANTTRAADPVVEARQEPVVEVQQRRSERVSTPMRERRTREPAHVIVHKGKSTTELYLVEREAR